MSYAVNMTTAAAPRLLSVTEILESELPLLVQQSGGMRLLLYKSLRIPRVVCQSMDSRASSVEYFFIPLDNQGFFGKPSEEEQETPAFNCLGDLDLNVSNKILVTSEVPVVTLTNRGAKQKDCLFPGDVIHIDPNTTCLKQRNRSPMCCFTSMAAGDAVCVNGPTRHLHIRASQPGTFYGIGEIACTISPGHVYKIKDLAMQQKLPLTVFSVFLQQLPCDEMTMPKFFRMLKVVSDRVIVAYKLNEGNLPVPDDVMQISSCCSQKFALLESMTLNLDEIRQQETHLSISKAYPGVNINPDEFTKIQANSTVFPPKLPRPRAMSLSGGECASHSRRHGSHSHSRTVLRSVSAVIPAQIARPRSMSLVTSGGSLLLPSKKALLRSSSSNKAAKSFRIQKRGGLKTEQTDMMDIFQNHSADGVVINSHKWQQDKRTSEPVQRKRFSLADIHIPFRADSFFQEKHDTSAECEASGAEAENPYLTASKSEETRPERDNAKKSPTANDIKPSVLNSGLPSGKFLNTEFSKTLPVLEQQFRSESASSCVQSNAKVAELRDTLDDITGKQLKVEAAMLISSGNAKAVKKRLSLSDMQTPHFVASKEGGDSKKTNLSPDPELTHTSVKTRKKRLTVSDIVTPFRTDMNEICTENNSVPQKIEKRFDLPIMTDWFAKEPIFEKKGVHGMGTKIAAGAVLFRHSANSNYLAPVSFHESNIYEDPDADLADVFATDGMEMKNESTHM